MGLVVISLSVFFHILYYNWLTYFMLKGQVNSDNTVDNHGNYVALERRCSHVVAWLNMLNDG